MGVSSKAPAQSGMLEHLTSLLALRQPVSKPAPGAAGDPQALGQVAWLGLHGWHGWHSWAANTPIGSHLAV